TNDAAQQSFNTRTGTTPGVTASYGAPVRLPQEARQVGLALKILFYAAAMTGPNTAPRRRQLRGVGMDCRQDCCHAIGGANWASLGQFRKRGASNWPLPHQGRSAKVRGARSEPDAPAVWVSL